MLVSCFVFASSFVFFVCFFFLSIGVVSLVFFLTGICSYFGEEKIYKRGSFDSFFYSWIRKIYPALMRRFCRVDISGYFKKNESFDITLQST